MRPNRVVTRVAFLSAAALAALPGAAAAGGAVSVRADLLPSARMHRKVDSAAFGEDRTIALGTLGAVAARATLDLTPNVAVGVAPRITFGVTEGPYEEVGRQIDLLGLVDAHTEIAAHTTLGAFATFGYSLLTLQPDPKGPALGVGARAERSFGAGFVSLELGYQLSFLHGSERLGASGIPSESVDESITTRFLVAGLGAGAHF
jgi:hypothetical protein